MGNPAFSRSKEAEQDQGAEDRQPQRDAGGMYMMRQNDLAGETVAMSSARGRVAVIIPTFNAARLLGCVVGRNSRAESQGSTR